MGAPHLIDTHVLVWLLGTGGPESVAAETLMSEETELVVSAATAYELAFKVRIGKLETARAVVDEWGPALQAIGARELPVTADHALAAGRLQWSHRDPFDRLLVAQAGQDRLRLVTADRAVAAAPGVDVLRW